MIDVSGEAVRKAIASGRLVDSVVRDDKGRPSLDPDIALAEWKRNTNSGRGSASRGQGAAIPVQAAGPKEAPDKTVTLEQASAYLERNGVDADAVRIVGDAVAPAPRATPAPDLAPGFQRRALERERGQDEPDADGTPDLNNARAWKEHYQAELARLDVEKRLGTLIDAAEAETRWSALIASCKTKLLAIPSKARSRLPKLDNSDVALLEKLVREALEELAQ
jgi:hypothetical protein